MRARCGEPCALIALGSDGGMVTAELAVALPTLVLVALLALCGVQVVMAEVRCRDAAGVAARLAARDENADVVSAAVASAAAPGSSLALRRDGDLLIATVHTDVRLLGMGRLLPGFAVTETAVSVDETPDAP